MNPEYQRRAQALEAALRISPPGTDLSEIIYRARELLAFLTEDQPAPAPADDLIPF